MDITAAFPSKYLRAADLPGRDVTVTIASVDLEDVGGAGNEDDVKPVVYFEGGRKGLVLNKTNSNTIAEQHGRETDDWVGKSVVLFSTTTDFGGRRVPCIRVRPASLAPPEENGSSGDVPW